MEYDYGTQFVYLDPVDNESEVPPLSDPATVTFENLSEDRQSAFERLLEEDRVEYGPDERNPFDWSDDTRPKYVRYDGQWYYVQVAIV